MIQHDPILIIFMMDFKIKMTLTYQYNFQILYSTFFIKDQI